MDPHHLTFAANVIRSSSKDRPTDGALRDALTSDASLTKVERRDISKAVFAYYRWKGVLPRQAPIEGRVSAALDWQKRFNRNPFSVPADMLAAKAMPKWVATQVTFPPEWLRWLQSEPCLWMRARPGTAKALAAKVRDCKLCRLPMLRDAVEYQGNRNLFEGEIFLAGEFEVQDIASQAVGALCDAKPGESWWDVCAGEGGKTLHLADMMRNTGFILATDRAAWRLEQFATRAARAKVSICRTQVWDGSVPLAADAMFDGVLVDAPCTGVGTWQRNPHARWTTTIFDVQELCVVQRDLLLRAAPHVKPGGRLIYAVCTMTHDETVAVCDAFDAAHAGFEPVPMQNFFNRLRPPAARVTLRPNETHGNGMFVAVWRRK